MSPTRFLEYTMDKVASAPPMSSFPIKASFPHQGFVTHKFQGYGDSLSQKPLVRWEFQSEILSELNFLSPLKKFYLHHFQTIQRSA